MRPSLSRRAAGVLLHPTSLPGPHGVGDLGPEALRFARFLADAGQTWWQMLPVGPVGPGDSPYSSPSCFAGSPLLVSLEGLVDDGLLEAAEVAGLAPLPEGRADFAAAAARKEPLLRKAFARFAKDGSAPLWDGFKAFHKAHAEWLEDWGRYAALREARGGRPWTSWEPALRDRRFKEWDREALRAAGESASYHQFVQYLFHRQWAALRRACADLGLGLIGDVPIYAALESADCWARRELWRLDAEGRPEAVAGVPPDYFSADGQLWGNPLYRWEEHRARGWDWWIARLRQAGERFEAVRLDHFIGFCRYWEVPASAATAREGRWRPGPGAELFEAVRRALPELELIAEDLGEVGEDVFALRDRFELPGMRVLQFAFGDDAQAREFLPQNHPRRCVAYTGTHDNDTTRGWWEDPGGSAGRPAQTARREKENARRLLGTDGARFHWDMLRALYASRADAAIAPAQDLLGLGGEARMNVPGTAEGNWGWRLFPGQLDGALAAEALKLVQENGRAPNR